MTQSGKAPTFEQLSIPEKILHVQDLWDRIAADAQAADPTAAQREELDRRLAAHHRAPGEASAWEEARARIRRSEG